LRSKIDSYPEEIQSRVEVVAKVKSRPFLERVESARDAAKSYVENKMWTTSSVKGGSNQKTFKYSDDCLDKAITNAQQISSGDGRKKAEGAIKEIRDFALDAKRHQFDEYQKWVVSKCKIGFNEHDKISNWYKLGALTTSTAGAVFDRSGLVAVDQSFLSPETARLFNDVLSKITGHMDGDGQFETQKKIAEQPKKKLEDF
jgi:hypothetical protein